MLDRLARGFALFVNWFDGVCAVVCGGLMMVLGLTGADNAFMPLSVYDSFPLHDVFFTSHFWPGLALVLVNGVPNLVALALRFRGKRAASYAAGMAAGGLLVAWTLVETAFMPNPVTVVYLVIGALQLAASWRAHRAEGARP